MSHYGRPEIRRAPVISTAIYGKDGIVASRDYESTTDENLKATAGAFAQGDFLKLALGLVNERPEIPADCRSWQDLPGIRIVSPVSGFWSTGGR